MRELSEEFSGQEAKMMGICGDLEKENVSLKENLALSIAHGKTLSKRLDDTEAQLASSNKVRFFLLLIIQFSNFSVSQRKQVHNHKSNGSIIVNCCSLTVEAPKE